MSVLDYWAFDALGIHRMCRIVRIEVNGNEFRGAVVSLLSTFNLCM
jgi:hypothetical protein